MYTYTVLTYIHTYPPIRYVSPPTAPIEEVVDLFNYAFGVSELCRSLNICQLSVHIHWYYLHAGE